MNTKSPSTRALAPQAGTPIKRYPRWIKLAFAFVAVALLLSQCVSFGFPTEGVVVDSETNQPLPNVWVNQWWFGREFCIPIPAPHSFCNHSTEIAVSTTQTDDLGRFRFARPSSFRGGRWGWTSIHPVFGALALGYERDRKQLHKSSTYDMQRWQDRDITIVMRQLTGGRVESLGSFEQQVRDEGLSRATPEYAALEASVFEQMRVMGVTAREWAEGIAYGQGDASRDPTPQMLVERRAQAALKAPSVIKENYAPYARYVDYLKKREKP